LIAIAGNDNGGVIGADLVHRRGEIFPRGGVEAPGVGRASEGMGGFLERLVVLEGEHHHGLIAIAGNDNGSVIRADLVHRGSEVFPRGGVGDGIHGVQHPIQHGAVKREAFSSVSARRGRRSCIFHIEFRFDCRSNDCISKDTLRKLVNAGKLLLAEPTKAA